MGVVPALLQVVRALFFSNSPPFPSVSHCNTLFPACFTLFCLFLLQLGNNCVVLHVFHLYSRLSLIVTCYSKLFHFVPGTPILTRFRLQLSKWCCYRSLQPCSSLIPPRSPLFLTVTHCSQPVSHCFACSCFNLEITVSFFMYFTFIPVCL